MVVVITVMSTVIFVGLVMCIICDVKCVEVMVITMMSAVVFVGLVTVLPVMLGLWWSCSSR